MMRVRLLTCLWSITAFAATSNGQISDDFEADTSADYSVVSGASDDGTVTFNFDYGAIGIGLAPNSAPGADSGVRFTANDTAGASDGYSAFHNTAITAPEFVLSVDMYMAVTGSGGTTEFAAVGAGSDGSAYNSIFSPISGSGHFLSMTGEGGSSSDFRHTVPGVGPVSSGDASYLDPANATNSTGLLYQSIFPGGDFPGSPGNRWTTVTITVEGGLITYALNGTPIVQDVYTPDGNLVSLNYADVFTSVATPAQSQFVVYDNFNVSVIPEPATIAMLGLSGFVIARRRKKA